MAKFLPTIKRKSTNQKNKFMRKILVCSFLLSFLLLTFSCSNNTSKKETALDSAAPTEPKRVDKNYLTDCKKLVAEAKHMDSVLMHQLEIDPVAANKAIKAFTDIAYYCSNDSLSPVFLIKTAQVARVINNIPQAKIALEKCIDTYPAFKNRPAALFLLAQLYDEATYLNNEEEARKLYNKIIEEYPKSEWASSAKGAINFLGKTDAQILEELKGKRKK
ncbi:hypothetical protein CNR22_05480 [Sphingobacteriaceae bacterium]|nr:hypothetical protein CNR22_05480 [Sphingobacteriaceae bacterium]